MLQAQCERHGARELFKENSARLPLAHLMGYCKAHQAEIMVSISRGGRDLRPINAGGRF
jgi:hypothetical protein